MKKSIKIFFNSFRFALQGLVYFFKNERNAKLHALATLIVVLISFYFRISIIEWIAIIFAIALVLIAEATNTAIEILADVVTLANNESIKKVKDIAAGAVLVAAFCAFIIGLFIFVPKIMLLNLFL